MKLNKITSAVLVAASLMAGAAQAETKVFDLTKIDTAKVNLVDALMSFQGFNPTWGTLTGVTVDISSDVTAKVALTNKNDGDRTLDVTVPALLKLTTPGSTVLSTSASLLSTNLTVTKLTDAGPGKISKEDAVTLHTTALYTGEDLALFTSPGMLKSYLSVSATTVLQEDRVRAVYSNFANGYGQVTYTFNAAPVPEPETYGMLLAGLALLGFVAKRNKRSA